VTRETRKLLVAELHRAYQRGDLPLVRQITGLLSVGQTAAVTVGQELTGACRQSLYQWVAAFMRQGMASLVRTQVPGRPPKLTKTQKQRLYELVVAGPEAAGYRTACWNATLLQELIQREFGVFYNSHYVCELLRNLGLSFQKARFVSDHLDTDQRQRWVTETWPEILRVARAKQAWLVFGDEASFAQWGSLSYTWAPQGTQPTVKTAGKRKGYKVWGALEFFTGQLVYQTQTTRFDGFGYQAFLTTVLAQTEQPIVLIQDGARYHTSQATREFMAAHADRLTVFQLPSYSPDYNPIEFVWRKVKRQATHNHYFPEFDDLQAAVDTALAALAKDQAALLNLFGFYAALAVPQAA